MHKNCNNEKKICVLFYQLGKNIVFEFNGKMYMYNNINYNKLKEQLVLPYKISFYNMSRAQVGGILLSLIDDKINVIYRPLKNVKGRVLGIETIFFEKQKILKK